jgi:hypothetical protein
MIEETGLGIQQPNPVEGPPQVPVGGMDQPHICRLWPTSDRTSDLVGRAPNGSVDSTGRGGTPCDWVAVRLT